MSRKRKRRPATKRAPLVCLKHGKKLLPVSTRYGYRYSCPVPGCSVASWNGSTSTPADDETRKARSEAHKVFDVLWKGTSTGVTRSTVYRSLAYYLDLPYDLTHIGMFSAGQCAQVMLFVTDFRTSGAKTYGQYKAWRVREFRDHGEGI